MKKYLVYFLFFSSIFSQQEKLVVSILEMAGEDMDPKVLKGCFKRLETSLIQSNRFQVIEKSQRKELLDEAQFQASGNCDDACAVEIGKLIGAEYLMLGEIIDFGGFYQIDIKIVNIERGDVTEKVTSEVEGGTKQLFESIDQASQEIVRRIASVGGTGPTTMMQAGFQVAEKIYSSAFIESTPAGATIMIDGVEKGFTPQKIEKIEVGTRKLMLIRPGYETLSKGFIVNDGKISNISEVLILRTGSLTILSKPTGAMVYLREVPQGPTPLNLQSLAVDEYYIRLDLDNYKPITQRINVQYDENTTQKFDLLPLPGMVNAILDPPTAVVTLEWSNVSVVDKGKKYKSTGSGITKIPLPVGTHKLKIKKKGYESQKRTVTIGPNESVPLEVNLKKKPAGISSNPDIGFLTVHSLNDKVKLKISRMKMIQTAVPDIQELPLDYFELKYGVYNLKAFKQGFESKKQSVTIRQQETEKIEINLKKKTANKALKYSMYFPGAGQVYAGTYQRGFIYGVTSIAMGALIGQGIGTLQSENDLMDQYYSDYQSATDAELISSTWDKYNSQVSVVNDTQTQLMIFSGVLAGSWIVSIIDAYFLTGLR